ncbi:MAG: TrmB family transcriptional regulator [Patescibacteria group bacterium]
MKEPINTSILTHFGLSKFEADLYALLLALGEVPVKRLIKESGMKRATVYKTLYELEEKALILLQDREKILHARAEDPRRLAERAERHIQQQNYARQQLDALLPEFMTSFLLTTAKPVVSTFDGIAGLKKLFMDTIHEKCHIYALAATHEIDPEFHEWLKKTYINRRVKAGIPATVIASTGSWARSYQKLGTKELRTTILVPKERFPFRHEINVYGDKVAMLNYKKGAQLIGVLIHHPDIAATMKAWFDLALTGAEAVNS